MAQVAACGSKDNKNAPNDRRYDDDDQDAGGNSGGSEATGGPQPADGGSANGSGEGGATSVAASGGNDATAAGTPSGGRDGSDGGTGGTGHEFPGDPGLAVPDSARGNNGPLVFQIGTLQSPAVPGGALTYVVTVGNTSALDVTNVSVVLNVPTGLSFGIAQGTVPTSSYCSNGVCTAGEEATWTLGTLEANTSKTIYIVSSVLGTVGAGDTIAAPFRLNAMGHDALTVTKSLPVVASADAQLALEAEADPVVPGQPLELVVNLGQISEDWIDAASLRLELPGGLALQSSSDDGSVDETGAIVWPLGDLDVGTTLRRTIKAVVHPGAAPGDVLNPRVSLTFDGGLEVDNVAELALTVIAEPQPLAFSITTLQGPARGNGVIPFQLTATNTGTRALNGLALTMLVPSGLQFYYTSDSQPDSSYCTNGTCSGFELANWDLGALPAGTSTSVLLHAVTPASQVGGGSLVTLPLLLSSQGTQPLNVFKTVPVFDAPDGRLVLGTAVSPVSVGQTFTYDIDVGQSGAAALNGSMLDVWLPEGVSIESSSDGGAIDGQVVSWSLGNVALGATVHRSVEVTVADDVRPGSALLARAELRYENDLEIDAYSELAVTVVEDPLPLDASLSVPAAAVTPGAAVTCTTTLKNVSTRTVDTTELLLRVPELSFYYTNGAEPDSSYCTNGTCSDGEEATWALGTISVGSTATVSLYPTIAPNVPGGTLVTLRQLVTATDLGASILLQKTIPTKP